MKKEIKILLLGLMAIPVTQAYSSQGPYAIPENFVVSLPAGVLPEPARSPEFVDTPVSPLVGAQISSQAKAQDHGWIFEKNSEFVHSEIVMVSFQINKDCPNRCGNPQCPTVMRLDNFECQLGIVVGNGPAHDGRYLVQYSNHLNPIYSDPFYLGKFGVKGAIGKFLKKK